ncbi:MAG TPA: hypothetical protein VKP65_19095, partial [Rhodothermales bacterium]|nr:hypothetical protein [Rhodothermales bacterium]
AEVLAPDEVFGYVSDLDALALGHAAVALGAGRRVKEDEVDPTAGIVLLKKPGDPVAPGEVLARLYTQKTDDLDTFTETVRAAYTFAERPPEPASLLLDRYTTEGWELGNER